MHLRKASPPPDMVRCATALKLVNYDVQPLDVIMINRSIPGATSSLVDVASSSFRWFCRVASILDAKDM